MKYRLLLTALPFDRLRAGLSVSPLALVAEVIGIASIVGCKSVNYAKFLPAFTMP